VFAIKDMSNIQKMKWFFYFRGVNVIEWESVWGF
jgi:hypothetical protein